MSDVGLAVVVTEIGPADVGMYAVTLIGFHTARGTQNHVPMLTTILFDGGAVLINNILTSRDTLLSECCAIRDEVVCGIQCND
jgi:hypothetical protein